MATKQCPRCGASCHKEKEGRQTAKHGAVHGASHLAGGHPLGALVYLVGSAIHATGLLDKYHCTRCGHKF